MRTRKIAVLLVALATLAWPQGARILFDGSMNGHLLGCHCTSAPKSGLIKRATFIQEYRKAHPGEVIVVSSGDLLAFGVDEKFAKGMLDAVASVGYDAIALGDQEFLAGEAFIGKMAKQVPLLSANLSVDGWLSDTRFPPSVVKTAGGLRVGFIAVTGTNVFRFFPDKKLREKLILNDTVAAIKEQAKALSGKCDAVVALTHQGLEADQALARALEGGSVHLILGGHSQDLTTKPLIVSGIPILHAGPSGNWQVEVPLSIEKGKVKIGAVKYHFFKYSDVNHPISQKAILGDQPWVYKYIIHENTPDDPAVARVVKDLGQ
jgi:2',3'-cyclic-nucleotide 2'-phosphodiesterase (5'-nucleotidase family)